jgi:NAD(P)-dependent dehydrogenase (short-subunit alcohol dehydrogenase family)
MKLNGKVALMTGASRGIGKRIALKLAEEGANLVLAARTVKAGESRWPGALSETAEQIQALGRRVLPVKCDLTVRSEVENLCQAALKELGHLDILVNNARYVGPGEGTWAPFDKITWDGWDKNIQVNLMVPIMTAGLLIPKMKERGGGVIINITSGVAVSETPLMPGEGATSVVYSTTKAALNRFVLGLAKEVRRSNIAVVAVDPGFNLTEKFEMAARESQTLGFDYSGSHSMDVPAETVVYLCTCANPLEYTGQVLFADDFVKEKGLPSAAGLKS